MFSASKRITVTSFTLLLIISFVTPLAFAQSTSSQGEVSLIELTGKRVLNLRDNRARVTSKIVGGTVAPSDRWPWAAAIAFEQPNGKLFQYCGGTLIDSRWVLTAAHCNVQIGDKMILGRSNLNSNEGEIISVANVVYTKDSGLPAFDLSTMDHDIVLVELSAASNQQPVPRIGAKVPAVAVGQPATVIGWGLLEEAGNRSEDLQQVSVPIFSNDTCGALYDLSGIRITRNMMCAGLHGKDSCQGDSGGGAFVQDSQNQDALAGIISFGVGCARPNFPGVYTRVSNYATWIVSVTGVDVSRLVDIDIVQIRDNGNKYVFASGEEIAQEQALIEESSRFQPHPEKWEFVEKRLMLDLDKARVNFDMDYEIEDDESVYEEEELRERQSPSMDLAIMGLPDGRIFRQKPREVRQVRFSETNKSKSGMDSEGMTDSIEKELEEDFTRQLVGSDNRLRSTSSSKPGVMVRIQSTSSADRGFCSGSMISPRVVLTAAHCITDSNGDFDYGPTFVVPAARGASYSGERKPQGARQVIRFAKPSNWKGRGSKYDYAMLVLSDLARDTSGSVQWNPKPVLVGYNTNNWLERKNFNLRGYPGGARDCADAASGDGGQCNGYAYYQDPAKKIHNAHLTWLSHKHDTQPGQSGAPIYYYKDGVRTVYAVHKGVLLSRNKAHRIRSGSFGLMCEVIEDYPSSHFSNVYCD